MVRRRAFSLIEVVATTAIVATVAGLAVAIGSRTSQGLDDSQIRLHVLDLIQRERNAHVNRGMETELLVLCPATGGSGDELVAYRVNLPAVFPPSPDRELGRHRIDATLAFAPGQALFVDAYARSVTAIGDPTNVNLTIRQKTTTSSILFRQEGSVLPSFDAPAAIVVAPKISDIGTRTTPNPTPQAVPNRIPRAREVTLE
jgi:prepilin-type N-terminal cleavage/methylation domain-containing protein